MDRDPALHTFCPGYELGRWRAAELAEDVFDRHLATFALPYSEYIEINHETAVRSLRRAARSIYATEKYSKRGEFGELILHSIIRDTFNSTPAISKIYFKDGPNETVKGFDAVHVVEIDGELELWLGEVKFYERLDQAIRDVTDELHAHLKSDYLRREFSAIINKLDPKWEHADRVARVLDENTSLDEIFDAVTIPVLLTYNSKAVNANRKLCDAYVGALKEEAARAWDSFHGRCDEAWSVRLRLILLPMLKKTSLVEEFQERLTAWQRR